MSSQAEQAAELLTRRKEFDQDEELPEGRFRCYHLPSTPWMLSDMCRNRVTKPHIFEEDCKGCPKWEALRKLLNKPVRIAQR